MVRRRRFSSKERIALLVLSGGVCELCGASLVPEFHADHRRPFRAGGPTDTSNGQALCPPCNLAKGGMMSEAFEPREWQINNRARFRERIGQRVYLLAATPGAGKTHATCMLLSDRLEAGEAERALIAVPTVAIKTQWAKAAAEFGIDLDHDFANRAGVVASDYQGVIATYGQIAASPELYRGFVARRGIVVLDEVHHLAEQRAWGEKMGIAIEYATRVICTTGTPFRSDARAIPFITYDVDGRCAADYTYSYGDALSDGVCRHVYFPSYEGNMRWFSPMTGQVDATFADVLPDEEDARRLRTALTSGTWLLDVLRDADTRLTDIRASMYPRAAGLAIAMDIKHAEEVAALLKRVTGQRPLVVNTEVPGAKDLIESFSDSDDRWIVSVRMISEGVDIKRLFVGVYATNYLTELFFRQFVGRFVRVIDGLDYQSGAIFIPRHDRLIEYAQRIKAERDYAPAQGNEQAPGPPKPPGPPRVSLWMPEDAQASAHDVLFDHESFSLLELAEAQRVKDAANAHHIDTVLVANIIRRANKITVTTGTPEKPSVQAKTLTQRKKDLRAAVSASASKLAYAAQLEHKEVFCLLQVVDGAWQADRTEAQLEVCKELLWVWIELANQLPEQRWFDWWEMEARRAAECAHR